MHGGKVTGREVRRGWIRERWELGIYGGKKEGGRQGRWGEGAMGWCGRGNEGRKKLIGEWGYTKKGCYRMGEEPGKIKYYIGISPLLIFPSLCFDFLGISA